MSTKQIVAEDPPPLFFKFNHPNDIRIGLGRVIWTQDGWVLPGGKRTTNLENARAVAQNIDTLSTNWKP